MGVFDGFGRKKAVLEAPARALKGYDDYEVRLGDIMRGERATLGKTLADVEADLRIGADYLEAIENADIDRFDTPGFVPGYVRSYAAYLGLDPEASYDRFCEENDFSLDIAAKRTAAKRDGAGPRAAPTGAAAAQVDPVTFEAARRETAGPSLLGRIDAGAIGSVVVLMTIIGLTGYGGWTFFTEIQRVQISSVEDEPFVLSDLDALAESGVQTVAPDENSMRVELVRQGSGLDSFTAPGATPRPYQSAVVTDLPINEIDPDEVSALRAKNLSRPARPVALAEAAEFPALSVPQRIQEQPVSQTVAQAAPPIRLVAVRPVWVRITSAGGNVTYERIMNAGEVYEVQDQAEPPTIRIGESGSLYFEVAGEILGPAGEKGSVTGDLALSQKTLTARYGAADIEIDGDLESYVARLAEQDSSE